MLLHTGAGVHGGADCGEGSSVSHWMLHLQEVQEATEGQSRTWITYPQSVVLILPDCSCKSTCTGRRCTAGPATPRSAGTRPRPAPAPPPSGRRPSRRRVRGAGARWRHWTPDGRLTQPRVQVFEAEVVRTRGRVFHKQCLSCCRCGHGLTVQSLHCDQVTSIIYPCSEVRTVASRRARPTAAAATSPPTSPPPTSTWPRTRAAS